jgi:hypothetical protein
LKGILEGNSLLLRLFRKQHFAARGLDC